MPRGRKKDCTIESLEELQAEPSKWLHLNPTKRKDVFSTFWQAGPYPCFALGSKCGSFGTISQAVQHNQICVRPMFEIYTANTIKNFRDLPKEKKSQYIREVVMFKKQVTCPICKKNYNHPHGFLYHIDRCGISKAQEKPWKCWRCGFEATQAERDDHLDECNEKALQKIEEMLNEKANNVNNEETAVVFGDMDDTNLRSGKKIQRIEETDIVNPKMDAETTVGRLVELGALSTTRRVRKRVSISTGIMPLESSRVKISTTGQQRFRFKKSDMFSTTCVMTVGSAWEEYRKKVEETLKQWKHDAIIPLSTTLVENKHDWSISEVLPSEFNEKLSVGFRFSDKVFPIGNKLPVDLQSIKMFESSKNENNKAPGDWITAAYAGGPIHTLKFAPNMFSNDEEVLMVIVYPDDESLITDNWKESTGYVQFWLVKQGETESCTTRLWFVLGTPNGIILSACWLDSPRAENDPSLIGYAAFSTAQGTVLIYRIDTNSVDISEGPITSCSSPSPLLILHQEPSTKEVNSEDEREYPPPLIRIEWSSYIENDTPMHHLAGVSAAGFVLVWDLSKELDSPKFLHDSSWSSPPVDLCFLKGYELIVAFREKLVRMYDIRTWNLLLEEETPRTAGARVVNCPQLLNGFLTFQADCFGGNEATMMGISYVATDNIAHGYFVVPLANRHEIHMWDASVSSTTGILATCGVDGQLLLSGNGRIVPRSSKNDSDFNIIRGSMLISKRRVQEESEKDQLPDAIFDYDGIHKKTWLEISIQPKKDRENIPYSSLEQRIESLNVVSTNIHLQRPIVVTGGAAGLLFFRPCRLDGAGVHIDPGELMGSTTSNKSAPSPPKKKRKA